MAGKPRNISILGNALLLLSLSKRLFLLLLKKTPQVEAVEVAESSARR